MDAPVPAATIRPNHARLKPPPGHTGTASDPWNATARPEARTAVARPNSMTTMDNCARIGYVENRPKNARAARIPTRISTHTLATGSAQGRNDAHCVHPPNPSVAKPKAICQCGATTTSTAGPGSAAKPKRLRPKICITTSGATRTAAGSGMEIKRPT